MTGPIGEPYSARNEIKRLKLKFKELQDWAELRYRNEVLDRPIENVYRKTLKTTWQQIIDKLNG